MTIFGWDMSHYDAPNIGSAVSDGITFITHKAGGDALDAELGAWWSSVKGLSPGRVLLGAYWVLYPGNPSGRADAFLARLDSQCPGWRSRPFILQVDCEEWGGDAGTVPSKSEIQAFCNRLRALMPKLKPIVYAPEWVYGDRLDGLSYPLWASRYVSGTGSFKSLYPGDSSAKWSAYSGQTPKILQYTSSATIAGQTTCDANAFRGTLDELTALVAPGWAEDSMALTPAETQDALLDALETTRGKAALRTPLTELAYGPEDARESIAGRVAHVDQRVDEILALLQSSTAAETARDATDVAAILAEIQAQGNVDEEALAAALVSPLAAAITAQWPAGSTPLTFEDVENAIRSVLVHGTEGD